MQFSLFTGLVALLTFFTAAITAVPIDQSPASELQIFSTQEAQCTSPHCAFISYGLIPLGNHPLQEEVDNVYCKVLDMDILGASVGACTCIFFSNPSCTGTVAVAQYCAGTIGHFKKPIRSMACTGWRG